MAKKPFILALDDDPAVLRAVERDLKSKFSADYRILASDTPGKAMDAVQQLTARGDRVALFLVDQRMPRVSGTEFLMDALALQPDARRVLLTAYADSSAAIDAINKVKLHHYLMKPWEPPEQNLYPVIADLLEDWSATSRESFDGIYIVGTRWSPSTHELKDFLAKSQIPYRWIEPGSTFDPRINAAVGDSPTTLPVLIFPDGSVLQKPALPDLAGKLGLTTTPTRDFYDVIIIGAGPAGLACALYCSTEGLRTILVEREAAGGQAGLSSRIENYLGFPMGVSGLELTNRAATQAQKFGAKMMIASNVTRLNCDQRPYEVKLDDGRTVPTKTIVIASGAQYKKPRIENLANFEGLGVYYGATFLESQLCGNEEVIVIGGGNSAGQAAVFLSQTASKVHMLVRSNRLSDTMSRYLIQRIEENPKIDLRYCTEIVAHEGDIQLKRVTWRDKNSGATDSHPIRHVFIMAGASPRTDWLRGCLALDDKGFILTGRDLDPVAKEVGWTLDRRPQMLETSLPGVFAVGDVRANSVKRVASAVGEGAIAVSLVHRTLPEL